MPDKLMIYSIEIGNLIIKNESREIEWYEILKAFGFEHLLKNNERLIQSYYFDDDNYKSNVIQLIYDALNKNENEGLKFIKYILKNYTNVSEEDTINVFPKDLNYLDSNKEKFNKCFISYLTKTEIQDIK